MTYFGAVDGAISWAKFPVANNDWRMVPILPCPSLKPATAILAPGPDRGCSSNGRMTSSTSSTRDGSPERQFLHRMYRDQPDSWILCGGSFRQPDLAASRP
jgi:hypothetical protein